MKNQILQGDCRLLMDELAKQGVIVQMAATSPPYMGLRSYNVPPSDWPEMTYTPMPGMPEKYVPAMTCCLGEEGDLDAYIAHLVLVFRSLWNILDESGTCWVNIGDSYAANRSYQVNSTKGGKKHAPAQGKSGAMRLPDGLKPKDMMGVPWRLAFAMQADGWYLRQDNIWCLSGGAWIYVRTRKGDMPMMVRDLTRLDPTTVKLWNGEKWTQVLGWGPSNDTSEKLELVLRSGERIGCTGQHLWPTQRGNVAAHHLQVGDIIQTCQLPEPEITKRPYCLTHGLLWLLGLYLAEGSRSEDTVQIALNADEIDWLDRIRHAAADTGATMTYTLDGNCLNVRLYGRILNALIDEYIGGRTAHDKHFRNTVWALPNTALQTVIEGYLDGDGSYVGQRIRLGFCRNYALERDLRIAAARLGATLTLKPCKADYQGGSKPAFRGEWRWQRSGHGNEKDRGEIVEIRRSRARQFWDISVADEPHLFSLASGVLTHNCKPNPMPESVKDRCVKAHEYMFLFSKKENYYFDHYGIQEQATMRDTGSKRHKYADQYEKEDSEQHRTKAGLAVVPATDKRNKRSVWTIKPKPYKGAHMAVFPPGLVEPAILAGTSEAGHCPECGKRCVRVVHKESFRRDQLPPDHPNYRPGYYTDGKAGDKQSPGAGQKIVRTATLGWKADCACGVDPVPDIVFDPFGGSGTTASVARELGRDWLTCELNPDYLPLMQQRIGIDENSIAED